jgi:DNA-binding transcriptional LysR family regulator
MDDWNDLKYLLALARHGSTLAAARALGVEASTVQRRLLALERRIGRPIVQRLPAGYRLTELGQGLVPHAEAVERAMQAFGQGVDAWQREATGVLRLTCPEPLMLRLMRSPLLERFHARHPGLRVEFVMSDRYLDLARGDADVALRSGDTDDETLVGRKVGDSLWAVYAGRDYVARRGAPARIEDLAQHALVGFDESLAGHRAAAWLREVAPEAVPVARCQSVLALVQAVQAGLGVAPLPTALGDEAPDLVRVLGPIPALTRIWRLLTTPALRGTPRVSVFFDFVVDELDALRPVITG